MQLTRTLKLGKVGEQKLWFRQRGWQRFLHGEAWAHMSQKVKMEGGQKGGVEGAQGQTHKADLLGHLDLGDDPSPDVLGKGAGVTDTEGIGT